MKEAARFVLDFLVEDPESGELLFGPSLSPEAQYLDVNGVRSGLCMSPAGDTQIIAGLFDRCVRAAELLGVDEDFRAELRAATQHLPAMRVGARGQLQEWREDHVEWEQGHRHVSHLFAVYPDAQITPRGTPELARAARRALELRIDEASDRSIGGWSVAWLSLLWARFHEGAAAHEQLYGILRKSTESSLLDLSPPGGTNPLTVFQIDGNLGAVAAVCEMLVQSHDGIELLPALPPEWPSGRVEGLRLRGGFEADIEWAAGRLVAARLRSVAGARCEVRSTIPLAVALDGAPVEVEHRDGLLCFDTRIGGDLRRRPRRPTRRRVTMTKTYWRGVFPAVTTQMRRDGSLDLDATARHLEVLLDSGVAGLVMCGSLGENQALDAAEKREVVEMAVATVAGRVPVLAGVAETSTPAACRYVGDCTRLGADGFMVMSAMVYRGDDREIVSHFRSVASATDRPLMIYNNPVSYGNDVTPALFAKLASIDSVVAIKESSADTRRITDIRNTVGDRFAVFVGVDDLALESAALGVDGWVAGTGLAFPYENQYLWDLTQQGDWKRARVVYRWYMPLLHLDTHPKLVQYIKLALQETGLGAEWVRAPRLPLVGSERTRVLEVIRAGIATRPKLPAALPQEDGRHAACLTGSDRTSSSSSPTTWATATSGCSTRAGARPLTSTASPPRACASRSTTRARRSARPRAPRS